MELFLLKKIQEQEVEPAHNAQYKIILSAQQCLDRLIRFFPLSICFSCIWPYIIQWPARREGSPYGTFLQAEPNPVLLLSAQADACQFTRYNLINCFRYVQVNPDFSIAMNP
jgi:hypothetical protein